MATTRPTSKSSGGGMLLLVFVIIVVAGAWMILSNHAAQRGTGELWSAERIFQTIQTHADDPARGPCRQLIVCECPYATVRDPSSARYGSISPQVRVFCQLNDSGGIMGVWGWRDHVGITAYYLRLDRFQKLVVLDRCVTQDITWLQRFLSGW